MSRCVLRPSIPRPKRATLEGHARAAGGPLFRFAPHPRSATIDPVGGSSRLRDLVSWRHS
jgi:hypothetical protein